jgi:hypothetical protein
MTGWQRLLIALSIVLVGMALIPYIALPSERFSWQLFANVYSDGPMLAINYDDGAPGSSFTITGLGYPANQNVTVKVNGHILGTTVTGENGGFIIHITSKPETDEGLYKVEVEAESGNAALAVSASGATRFRLSASAPLLAAEGAVNAFTLPDGIASNPAYLPVVIR